MRIFLGYADVAGFASRLASLLVEAGHEVEVLNTFPNAHNPTRTGREGFSEVWCGFFAWVRRTKERSRILYGLLGPIVLLGRLMCFVGVLRRAEAMVFIDTGRLLPRDLDRRLARWLGRRTINVYLGSASRPLFMSGAGHRMAELSEQALRKLATRLRRQRKRVRTISALSDVVVENPLCSQFQERTCVDWFRLGFPGMAELSALPEKEVERGEVIIVHAPSMPQFKGTRRIRAVIEKLRGEGLPIRFIEITGRPHAEVLEALARCDFVIDELYSDSPLAGFASEAAHFGKPAVVGGYGWKNLRSLRSAGDLAPSVLCRPEELEEKVRMLSGDPGLRAELGARAKDHVDEFLGGSYAQRFEHLLRDEIPGEWLFDPREVVYVYGFGQREEELRMGLGAFLDLFGVAGLCLESRPDLLKAIEEFVASSPQCPGPGV